MTAVHGQQYIGQRETQEDSFDIIRQSEQDPSSDLLMLLSDGMGGHAGGEVASNLSIQTFRGHFIGGARAARPLERLQESLVAANDAIRGAIQRDGALRGMGCTFIGAIKIGNVLHWASVGDSALYLFRRGELTRVNADHSVLGELMGMVEKGKLTRAEALAHPRRNALRSALTGAPIALVDVRSMALERDDLVLLASDGLDTLSQAEVSDLLARSQRNPREAASLLLQAVERRAATGQDNTTVVVYRHSDGPASALVADSKWTLGQDGRRFGVAALGVACCVLIGVGLGYALWQPAPAPAPVPAPVPGPVVAAPAPLPAPAADQPVEGAPAAPRNGGIPDTSNPPAPAEPAAPEPAPPPRTEAEARQDAIDAAVLEATKSAEAADKAASVPLDPEPEPAPDAADSGIGIAPEGTRAPLVAPSPAPVVKD